MNDMGDYYNTRVCTFAQLKESPFILLLPLFQVSSRYCHELLINHIMCMATPLTNVSIDHLRTLDSIECGNVLEDLRKSLQGTTPLDPESLALLAPGVCALYGSCSPDNAQYIHAALTGSSGGSSQWVSCLNEIKALYEAEYRYIGKV